ncbi:hypothetical protein CPC16_010921 [Podila verticillata]|nr:hypothetical protein BGZ59_011440 [Podila verticillata]KAF9379110.1 hypothetical protein CPC16_010921 [Podila verticillata]KFH64595.1 hypothetical protein MVEG_09328 [Podila verticillata NRRL 6337]
MTVNPPSYDPNTMPQSFTYQSTDTSSRPSNATTTSFSTTTNSYSTTFPYSSHVQEPAKFKVLIVGAGIGGLMLGYCLERCGIEYVILERMGRHQVAKSAIQLTANTLLAIEQMGLLPEVMRIAKPVSCVTLRKHNMTVVGKLDTLYCKERYGYHSLVVKRTEFIEILIKRMGSHRIQWNRKVLEVVNGNAGVQCRCANNHVEQGDIIVGADGAHSAVRQNLYRSLQGKNVLPKSDTEDLKFTQNAVMGMTNPLDLNMYPAVGARFTECNIIIGKESPYTMWINSTAGNRINWCVTGPLLTPDKTKQNFAVSEFGPEAVEAVCDLIHDLKIPFGGTLGDLIMKTPKECITKVLVEEKHYKTWHYGRTVLIGEAVHKFASFSGQGAEQAILDAICLVNLLHKLNTYELHEITKAFEAYQEERLPVTKAAVQVSGQVANLLNSQGFSSEFKRKIVFNLPNWVRTSSVDKMQVRPTLDFLPKIEDRGSRSIKSAYSIKSF